MSHEVVLWVGVIACSLHVLEETLLDWVGMAQTVAPFKITWSDFYIVNAAMIVGAVAAAAIGWKQPEISLIIPALMVINAVFFHIGGTLVLRKFSPGLITSIFVYLPVAGWTFAAAASDGVLSAPVIGLSALGGAAVQAFPIALLALKSRLRRAG